MCSNTLKIKYEYRNDGILNFDIHNKFYIYLKISMMSKFIVFVWLSSSHKFNI